jgi:DNA-binding GntR family transcriptional regulator
MRGDLVSRQIGDVLGEALRRRIFSMELKPGAVVDEVALSTEFGLSRPPVRELFRQLAAEGRTTSTGACTTTTGSTWRSARSRAMPT